VESLRRLERRQKRNLIMNLNTPATMIPITPENISTFNRVFLETLQLSPKEAINSINNYVQSRWNNHNKIQPVVAMDLFDRFLTEQLDWSPDRGYLIDPATSKKYIISRIFSEKKCKDVDRLSALYCTVSVDIRESLFAEHVVDIHTHLALRAKQAGQLPQLLKLPCGFIKQEAFLAEYFVYMHVAEEVK
jgi:hypothetical protein